MRNKTLKPLVSNEELIEQPANGWQNGRIRRELLQQFQRQGVTQPLPVDFVDAISPRRHRNGSGPDGHHRNGHEG